MIRIGQGYDVHALVEGRPLILGGVKIPHVKGLLGHSDADVLLHAITDAILGALSLGDIGKHFPDTDPAYKDADSRKLLAKVWEFAKERGYSLGNLDATVMAQKPKLLPYIPQMVERLGFVGREEGIAALAVVSLIKQET
jgi:2-C-methyl-D-erythritol 2,4-cyclodiphosphate synthase